MLDKASHIKYYCLVGTVKVLRQSLRRRCCMQTVENLVKTSLEEIEKVLSTRTVVGEPISVEGASLIPLISVGFAFGAGGGAGKGEAKQKGEGEGGGTAGGAYIRPVAMIIIDKSGVRIEPIRGAIAVAIEKMAETVPQMMEKCMEKCGPWRKREE